MSYRAAAVAVVVSICVSLVVSEGGGMAELKAITGDAPYHGPGNAPAFVPQPQGFWGGPRYYGGGGSMYGGNPFYGGNNVYGGHYGGHPYHDGDRFSSISGSPYGGNGFHRREFGSLLGVVMGLLDGDAPSRSHPASHSFSRAAAARPSSTFSSSAASSPSFPASSSSSLPALGGGGGFYKGRGNSFSK